MNKMLLCLCLLFCQLSANAQQVEQQSAAQVKTVAFGYFSYDDVMKQMPDYAVAERSLQSLRDKYAAEMKRVEDEFNAKYEQFLDGQRDFAPSILQKRQAELQELMQKNQAFKEQTEELLEQAEQDAYAPLREKLSAAVQRVGQNKGLAFILNTDNNAVPYINPVMGVDVTAAVLNAVR